MKEAAKPLIREHSSTFAKAVEAIPAEFRQDIKHTLYDFVRTADQFVDAEMPDKEGFERFYAKSIDALGGKPSGDPVIDPYASLSMRKRFEIEWTDAFFSSMRSDFDKKSYANFNEVKEYMKGSAGVIGLMFNRVIGLPREADRSAFTLGEAYQYANMIRDIGSDLRELDRVYMPEDEQRSFGIDLRDPEVGRDPNFSAFIRAQVERQRELEKDASGGYSYLPDQTRAAVKTASRLYENTLDKIYAEPTLVLGEKKVKPSLPRKAIVYYSNKLGSKLGIQ